MAQTYYELRNMSGPQRPVAADIARHLQPRQHLGTAVVICERPVAMMSSVRKQWLGLARSVQRDRSSTLNADKILRFTHAITHMQHLTFSAKPYHEQPAQVYFITPATTMLPLHCYTAYIAQSISGAELQRMQSQFAPYGLLVDYTHEHSFVGSGFQSKTVLEANVTSKWAEVAAFFDRFGIDISSLSHHTQQSNDRMDDALDTLLGIGHEFLHIARDFQHTFELAQPLDLHMQTKQQYMTLSILAHRVQSLLPGPEYYRFNTRNADEHTFFLHDRAPEALSKLELAQEATAQLLAGRTRLANALQAYLLRRPLLPL